MGGISTLRSLTDTEYYDIKALCNRPQPIFLNTNNTLAPLRSEPLKDKESEDDEVKGSEDEEQAGGRHATDLVTWPDLWSQSVQDLPVMKRMTRWRGSFVRS
jgi:hypothetical protein